MAASEVVPGVFVIDTKPMGREKLEASFLVVGSEASALIDPGFACSAGTVADEVRAAGVAPEELDYIVLTHAHIDHAGAVGHLAKVATRARIVCHQRGVFYLKNGVKIGGGAVMVFGEALGSQLGQVVDTPGERIDTVPDGGSVDLGDKRLTAYHTPGHCGDHISWFEESTGTLFPGDTACLHYPQLGHVLIPAGSPPVYRTDYIVEELTRLGGLDVRTVLTPHFASPDTDPSAFLAANSRCAQETRKRIDAMFRQGIEFSQVVEKLRDEILQAARADRPDEADAPEFLSDVWLRVMLKTGLMGYMADILEYARDLRPFRMGASA